jgi:radical copper oxidase GlxA-like protein/galactose oxidase-like protein
VSGRGNQRLVKALLTLLVAGGLIAINGPTLVSAGKNALHDYKINSQGYKEQHGHWSMLSVPEDMRVNAIHAALLRTGKVLIIAGSGNDRKQFEAGKFHTVLWDPDTDKFTRVHTPSDMFCAGHVFLPDGKLLIAGGTRRYEKLREDITHAAGVMKIKNESPDGRPLTFPKGTEFLSPRGQAFKSTKEVVVRPAAKKIAADGTTTVTASAVEVWVEAVEKGAASVVDKPTQFTISGAHHDSEDLYGFATSLTRAKQDYWGDDKSYLFDPATEKYERVDNMTLARWYPTLVPLKDGRVLSVSGLDEFGRIIEGDNEIYDPQTKQWEAQPQLQRTFPTYPSLFLMPNGKLFYTGSNAGYGSDTVGRDPGIWDLSDNSFKKVPGLRESRQTETSGSVLLPPAQDQRYMIAGGGGIGESDKSTARTDIIDLHDARPHFEPGPDLERPVRYPNMVITPDDKVVITGGSSGYRGENDSDQLLCHLYDVKTGDLTRMADPTVGRNYHSEALLLPDGRVITLGSDPLFSDADNTKPGTFEKRIEIYSPPYLFQGDRPEVASGPENVQRGDTVWFGIPRVGDVKTARLVRPSAVTHVTDVEQRSIKLDTHRNGDGLDVTIPSSAGLVPSGWYMLFVTDENGAPSKARWVHVR